MRCEGGSGSCPSGWTARWPTPAGSRSPTLLRLLGLQGRARDGREGAADPRERPSIVARPPCRRSPSTSTARRSPISSVRAGRRRRSASGQVAEVPEGRRSYRPLRRAVRTARADLRRGDRQGRGEGVPRPLPREIEHDNPEIRRADELARFLSQLYNREVRQDDIVTVIRFSQITNS